MSNDKKVYTHEVTIRFECDDTNALNWLISTDDAVDNTLSASYEDLARAGAPLSALGIRVLRDLLAAGLLNLALDRANNYMWKAYFDQHAKVCGVAFDEAAERWLAKHEDPGTIQ